MQQQPKYRVRGLWLWLNNNQQPTGRALNWATDCQVDVNHLLWLWHTHTHAATLQHNHHPSEGGKCAVLLSWAPTRWIWNLCPFFQRIQTGPPRVDPAHEWESENDKQFGKMVQRGEVLSSETFSCGPAVWRARAEIIFIHQTQCIVCKWVWTECRRAWFA